jgi:16S rRNA (adenine1518-N6/adenine1519-N6)-dimethyltransferase
MSRFPTANKSFGQHFLSSPTVINKITSPLPEGTDAIVEIGPGPAVLTPHLAKYNIPLYVIEMDERFVEILEPVVGPDKIFRQDALLFNWNEFLEKHKFKNIWLVSNLPYNVSVPLTLSFLRIPEIKTMTLMYQKEVAEKILPKEMRNAMGSLHALTLSQFEINHVVHAPPGAFVPPPKVDSSVLKFKRREKGFIDLPEIDHYETYLRVAFANRRKQLGGILKKEWGSDVAQKSMEAAGLSLEIRAEALTFNQVLNLYAAYTSFSSKL